MPTVPPLFACLVLASGLTAAAQTVVVAPDDVLFEAGARGGEAGFASDLTAVGDLDGDGIGDLAVAIPQVRAVPGGGSGRVRVTSGADGSTLFVLKGRFDGEAFGTALCRVGDQDGDGVDDLVVGAPRDDVLAINGGALRLHSGRDGSPLTHPVPPVPRGQTPPPPEPIEWPGGEPFGRLGACVVSLPDLDGDGLADLAASAPSDPDLSFEPGYVVVCTADGLEPLLEIWGDDRDEAFGAALATVPDLDDDGTPELAIGAPTATVKGGVGGRVVIVSPRSARILLVIEGEAGERFGSALARVPDLDGDGLDELLVGAPGASSRDGAEVGAAHVVSLRKGKRLLTVTGDVARDRLGSAVASAGDVDGDGVPDLALGAPGSDAGAFDGGRVLVARGTDGRAVLSIDGDVPGMRLGRSLLGLGDVGDDGFDDLAVGLHARPDRAAPPGAVRAYAGREPVIEEEAQERGGRR
jgi:hypothetical protein